MGYMTCFKNVPQMEHPERPSREKGGGGNTPLCWWTVSKAWRDHSDTIAEPHTKAVLCELLTLT